MSDIATTSDCLEAFLEDLDLDAVAKRTLQMTAERILRDAIDTYDRAFGQGEVGKKGSAKVPPRGGSTGIPAGTTGLMYGKVQSGKTNATVASAALAFENGFRTVVVLTSDNTLLGRQTFKRFRDGLASDGPRMHDWEDWRGDPAGFGRELKADGIIEDKGILLVATKNVANLKSLDTVLKAAGAGEFPALVMDDEADNASLNTFTARNARTGGDDASRVFEQIGHIRNRLPHHIYVQVTATPQSLLLQAVDHPCRPAFCVNIQPGREYTGGDVFFDGDHRTKGLCVPIDPGEAQQLRVGRVKTGRGPELPEGLRKALCTFFLAAAFKHHSKGRQKGEPYSILIHISQRQIDHANVAGMVATFVTRLDKAIRGRASESEQNLADRWLAAAWQDLRRTAADLPPLEDLKRHLARTLTNAIPSVVNADMVDTDVDYRPGVNILIGGNRLGRGLTIPGLIVTYYTRDPKVKMSDTVHQHARMFGYRSGLIDVARLYSTPELITTFKAIHEADEGMRQAIGDNPAQLQLRPVWVGEGLRPTRSNVLNPAEIGGVRSGIAIYPPDPRWKRADIETHSKKLDRMLAPYQDDEMLHEVPLSLLSDILRHMPSRLVSGYTWEDRRVQQILQALANPELKIAGGILNVRRGRNGRGLQLERQDPPFAGFADSSWVKTAKSRYPKRPTLIVMMEEGSREKRWDGQRLYLPTLVLPDTGFVFMFNYTEPDGS